MYNIYIYIYIEREREREREMRIWNVSSFFFLESMHYMHTHTWTEALREKGKAH